MAHNVSPTVLPTLAEVLIIGGRRFVIVSCLHTEDEQIAHKLNIIVLASWAKL